MTMQTYRKLINKGIKGLPRDNLAEIVNFTYFLRKRTLLPKAFEGKFRRAMLNTERRQFRHKGEAHLEKEF